MVVFARVTILLLFLLSLNLSLSALVFANAVSVEHLQSIEDDINRDPYPVYRQLLEIEKQVDKQSDAYLWLLYRKAQAETLLYFYPKFDQTIAQANKLITDDSPKEIISSFAYFGGLSASRKGEYTKAINLLAYAENVAEEANLNRIYVVAKQELAFTRSLTELYEISLLGLQEAYVKAFAMNDQFLIAVINETYGAVYGYMEEFEKSIEYYQKAYDTYFRLGYKPYTAEAVYGLASTYRYWQKYEQAIEKFVRYRETIAFTPNQDISFYGPYGLAMTYAEKGDCQQALITIEQALNLNGLIDYNAELYKKKALCLLAENQIAEAEVALINAIDIFAKIPELDGTRWQLDTVKITAMIHNARGEHQQAYLLLKEYYENTFDLMKENASKQRIRVLTAMELERQSIEISLLQQQSKVQQLEFDQQAAQNHQQMYVIAITSGIILFVLIIVYLQYRYNRRVVSLSIVDPLTGIYNRRYVFENLDRVAQHTVSNDGELSVLLFDIDDFKQVNDQYGHPFGDKVLKQCAQIAANMLRSGDVLGRVGGEEFLAILPRTDQSQAMAIAQRLVANISQSIFELDEETQIKITVSVGVSSIGALAQDRAALYIQSDKALYFAKHSGKDQVQAYTSELA